MTGALVYVDGYFLQILEGPADTVRDLVARIGRDTRHAALKIVHEAEVEAPMFSGWRMAYLTPTPDALATWLGLPGAATLEQILAEVHEAPARGARVAEGILQALA